MSRRIPASARRRAWLLGAILVAAILLPGAVDAEGLAGSQGTDTALPLTDSFFEVSGRPCPDVPDGCGFQDLRFTVNQTKDLVNQAVSVTWTGGRRPVKQNGNQEVDADEEIYGNFVQIFQCWGEDDGTNTANPGPPPEKCQFGGFHSNRKGFDNLNIGGQFAFTRVMNSEGTDTYASEAGFRFNGQLWKPFQAVDGTIVKASADTNIADGAFGGGSYWLNPYFDAFTTNEDVVARSHVDGTGSELVTVVTGLEAAGLGCGQRLEVKADGSKGVPKCWLVIVPRSTGAVENPAPARSDVFPVTYSPLAPTAWQNRIAVPLDFKPLDSPCVIGADERRIAGSELAGPAVGSWQPKLCATPGSPPYSYSPLSDDRVRQQVATAAPGAPGMAVMSGPIDPERLGPENAAIYAPLTLSGVTIGFNIERVAARDPNNGGRLKDPEERRLEGIRVARLNLTPRLVAKLLAQSYQDQFFIFKPPASYDWYGTNPKNLLTDPDFVQFNPEFANLAEGSVGGAGRLVVELPSSDAAFEVWRWVLADPEAKEWLAGARDPWGTQVNPFYSTNPARNPSGTVFGDPLPNFYPKSDPFCYQDQTQLTQAGNQLPRPLCTIDIAPYAPSMQEAALATRAASDRAVTELSASALTPETAWKVAPPQPPGRRVMLSITDTASASRYGLQTAKLSRSGDNAADRAFIAPDNDGLLAGQRAMTESAVPGVLSTDPATRATGAYPLTMLTYGAALPASLDAASRKDFAAFIDYAAGPGQVPGVDFGQLPPGYAPLPDALRTQAKAAATALRKSPVPAPAPAASRRGPAPRTPAFPPGASPPEGAQPAGGSIAPDAPPAPGLAPAPGKAPPVPPSARQVVPTGATPEELAGFVRFAMPIAAGLGLMALLGVLVVDDRWFRALASRVGRPEPGDPPVQPNRPST